MSIKFTTEHQENRFSAISPSNLLFSLKFFSPHLSKKKGPLFKYSNILEEYYRKYIVIACVLKEKNGFNIFVFVFITIKNIF